jgi:hypothetical protein
VRVCLALVAVLFGGDYDAGDPGVNSRGCTAHCSPGGAAFLRG